MLRGGAYLGFGRRSIFLYDFEAPAVRFGVGIWCDCRDRLGVAQRFFGDRVSVLFRCFCPSEYGLDLKHGMEWGTRFALLCLRFYREKKIAGDCIVTFQSVHFDATLCA